MELGTATAAPGVETPVVDRYGGAASENDPLFSLAVRDDAPLVAPPDPT